MRFRRIYTAAKPYTPEIEEVYRSIIPVVRKVARQCGYAIGVHGSLRRDLDLIAVPWVKKPLKPETLVLRIEKAVCKYRFIRTRRQAKLNGAEGDRKPHGRVAYVIMLGNKGAYMDLSVMPTRE